MKKTLLLVLVQMIYLSPGNAQNSKADYFVHYNNSLKQVIKNHWVQYFQEDIYYKIDSISHVFPIKFDSYGSPYPESTLFNHFKKRDFDPRFMRDNNLFKFSLYHYFQDNKKKIKKGIADLHPDNRNFYNSILEVNSKEKFDIEWNNYHFQKLVRKLNMQIKNQKKSKILFFIHGYNVPYSLANIQLVELIRTMEKQEIDTSQFLFVPVFWSSNDAKKCKIKDKENFSTRNIKNLRNGLKFLNYSNRAYFAAIGLRRIVNGIDNNKLDIYFFSHSLGATVATTALINTFSKLDYNSDYYRQLNSELTEKQIDYYKKKEVVNYPLIQELKKFEIPNRPIKIFLSAAGIPGENTFNDMDTNIFHKHLIYCPINYNDEMLTKNSIPLPCIRANHLGSTTLGCDYQGEARLTKNLFYKWDNFKISVVENNVDHDILTYLYQPSYVKFIRDFFNE